MAPFQPCVLRHTAGSNLNRTGADAFVLARIMGLSDVRITRPDIHPQHEAAEHAFQKFAGVAALPAPAGPQLVREKARAAGT